MEGSEGSGGSHRRPAPRLRGAPGGGGAREGGGAAGAMELQRAVELRRAISAGAEAERAVRRYGALEETEWKAEALGRSEWGLPGGAAGGPARLRVHPRAP